MTELSTITSRVLTCSTAPTRDQIMSFQNMLMKMPLPPVDEVFPVQHFFAPGMYIRQMFLPAGGLVIGRIHKHAHANTISWGKVTVVTEFGRETLVGPVTFISKAGTKRIVCVHEDTVWTTYHLNPNDETDPDKLVAELTAETYDDLREAL